jgi:hypothetical protein
MDRGDDLARRIGDRRRDRRDARVELLDRPGIAVASDRAQPLAHGHRVGQRAIGKALECRLRQVALDGRRCPEGEQDLARRHRVQRRPRPRPVADDDRMGRVDLIDVVDEIAVRHPEPGRLAGRVGQIGEHRTTDGRQ